MNNTTTHRHCAALTKAGLPCRAPAVRDRDFCATHDRLGAGVKTWGGPYDGLELRTPEGLLASAVAVVWDESAGCLTFARREAIEAGEVQSADVLGWYNLSAPGPWRHGIRYRWHFERARAWR